MIMGIVGDDADVLIIKVDDKTDGFGAVDEGQF